MLFKVHRHGRSTLVSVCSDDLLGKKFREEKNLLDVNNHFFGGEKLPLSELKNILQEFDNVTLVGNDVVDEAVRRGFIKIESIKVVKGVKWGICLKG